MIQFFGLFFIELKLMVWKELNRSAAANLASIIKYKEAKFSFKSDRLWYAYELFRNESLKSTNSEMLIEPFSVICRQLIEE
jgi:hypothetical protein